MAVLLYGTIVDGWENIQCNKCNAVIYRGQVKGAHGLYFLVEDIENDAEDDEDENFDETEEN